jgi:hypothetical protein
MRASLPRFLRLPAADQLATAEALVVVLGTRIAVSLVPGPVLARWVRRAASTTGTEAGGEPGSVVQTVCAAVRRASVRVPGATCLVQALSGWIMLRRRHLAARMELGIDKRTDTVAAHAWLVVDERVVLGGQDARARFVVLETREP